MACCALLTQILNTPNQPITFDNEALETGAGCGSHRFHPPTHPTPPIPPCRLSARCTHPRALSLGLFHIYALFYDTHKSVVARAHQN